MEGSDSNKPTPDVMYPQAKVSVSGMDIAKPVLDLPTHEKHSEARAERVISTIKDLKGSIMSHEAEGVSVKNIFEPGGGHDGGGNNMWAAVLPALMAERGGRHDGFGMGGGLGGAALGFIAGALVNNRNGGGLFGGGGNDGGSGQATSDFIALQTLGNIQRDIATSANETQAVVNAAGANNVQTTLAQTIALERDLSQLALGTQQAFANTKDSIQTQNTLLAQALCGVNQNVSSQGCQTREAISNDGDKTRAMLFARFQLEDSTRINELNARVIELQSEGRRSHDTADLRLQITNTNTAVAAQAQGQAQQQQQQQAQDIAGLRFALNAIIGDIQAVRQGQVIFNSGTMAASGTQAAANTRVN